LTVSEEVLFGWDPTPGIVSIWADREGHVLLWQRMAGEDGCTRARFRPWMGVAIALGVSLGVALDNLALGIGLGVAIGGVVSLIYTKSVAEKEE
jgi:hypothetical protein